jgi:hypothetical protein
MDINLHKYNCCDFSKVDKIGVLCRGKSLGVIDKYKDYFKNSFVVGQHYRSFKLIGKSLKGYNLVKVWGSTFNKPSRGYKKQYEKFNIRDMQTYLDPTLSPRKSYKFKKITKRNDGILEVFPRPLNFLDRNKRIIAKANRKKITHPTIGMFAVDLAAAYKPNDIYIIGLDFYSAPDFVKEKKHISTEKNSIRESSMIEYFRLLCSEEKDIKFHLYTRCKRIKSENNLEVVHV